MKKTIKIIFVLIIILIAWNLLAYYRGINTSINKTGEEKFFKVSTGESVKLISENLLKEGLINSTKYFEFYIWQNELQSSLQAGEYSLRTSMNVKEITEILSSGKSLSREQEIKIIEGWNIADIDEYLSKNNITSKNIFANLVERKIQDWQLKIEKPDFLSDVSASADLEGFLFPDTYKIFNDATASDITEKMLDNFDNKLTPELRDEINNQDKSIFDIITMASIIEKEVSKAEDRAIVAGILYKRLEIGMRMEVDATINYITGKNNPSSTYIDLEIDSPYNTYKYYGLPPGPISNPGISAIKAAVYPQKSDYLFYLNRQDTKETIFSKNYEEHLRNKAKYLK